MKNCVRFYGWWIGIVGGVVWKGRAIWCEKHTKAIKMPHIACSSFIQRTRCMDGLQKMFIFSHSISWVFLLFAECSIWLTCVGNYYAKKTLWEFQEVDKNLIEKFGRLELLEVKIQLNFISDTINPINTIHNPFCLAPFASYSSSSWVPSVEIKSKKFKIHLNV